jgi:dTDP-4-dehydrorhamnose reductase
MRLLVPGAAGMVGTAFVALARDRGHEVQALTQIELDIVDATAVEAVVAASNPDGIVNCAGWTDVDGAEAAPEAAGAVNGDGAGNLARAAAARDVTMVHVSTDYVFSGDATRPYLESDPPAPKSAYGHSKLAGEQQVLAASDRHMVVRTSWLFGAGGRNFVDTMVTLGAERDEVSVVVDQVGCPTWTGHLAPALLELAERGWAERGSTEPGSAERDASESGAAGIFHVAGSGSCSWNELAREVFEQAGVRCRVRPATTAETPRPAPRPAYSVLASERADAPHLPSWREGVRGHLAQRRALAGEVAR